MSRTIQKPSCAFDWEGGRNDKLENGVLLEVSDHLFAYVFSNSSVGFTNGFIASKHHGQDIPALLTAYPSELGKLLRTVIGQIGGGDSYNVYANEGRFAGMTVGDHAHLHVLRRSSTDPASGMGFGKLVKEYNQVYRTMWSSGT